MSDIEISRKSKKMSITNIGKSIGLSSSEIIPYGKYKGKIQLKKKRDKKGKLILVTAISPTPLGEGKTTVSIGLGDALKRMGKKVIIALREPSMGPVFGMKGGACGGGYSQVVPMEDINLHFTGDFHAITSANNLICAAIDNHIYFGNELDIQEVTFHRTLDVNDRALRDVSLLDRKESFTITSASEIMALFCLASSMEDLRDRLGNIIIGINSKGEFIRVKQLKIEGSLMALLKDAFLPNLVQTLENTPAIIHGGPFANIAHGCNSIQGTTMAMSLADYVVTEAGFGADLGAEKFFDIKCRVGNLKPDCVVLVSTIKALKYHGGVPKEDIFLKNDEALRKGFANLDKHYENLSKYQVPIVVCLNQFDTDTSQEIQIFEEHCKSMNYSYSISTAYRDGGEGATSLASQVLKEKKSNFQLLYDEKLPIKDKIQKICCEIYGASKVNYVDGIDEKIQLLEKNHMTNLLVCVAKTQYSFSDDSKKYGVPKDFEVTVKDIQIYGGASFITVLLGNIILMPGLSRKPNYELIDVCDGEIINLS